MNVTENIKERYKPYNFSSTKCHVIRLLFKNVGGGGIFGIEEKLPVYIGTLKGIYVTCKINSSATTIGGIILNFNECILKNFQMYLYNTKFLKDTSHPFPLDEEIRTNSIMQGFYSIVAPRGDIALSGWITIYLHYTERSCGE